jgi:hypothetical protein
MNRRWFREDSPSHWTPSRWQGWCVIAGWVVIGPILGAIPIFFIRPAELGVFGYVGWVLFTACWLIVFVTNNAEE